MTNWLKRIFGGPDPSSIPQPVELPATTTASLADALRTLPPGDPAWISIADAARLFSHAQDRAQAFGEMDEAAQDALASFAAEHGCAFRFASPEERVYFTRKAT